MKATFVYLAMQLISIQGLHLDLERHSETEKICLKLHCMENKTDDTEMSALVNMSVYWISESDEEVMLASISESDSRVEIYKTSEAEVTGKISKDYGELIITSFSSAFLCNLANFACEVNFINKSRNHTKRVYYARNPDSKHQKAMLLMTLKAKTYDYVTTVEAMANFLKSFRNPNRENSADIAMSLQMLKSESGQHSEDIQLTTTSGINESDKHLVNVPSLPSINSNLNNKTSPGTDTEVPSQNCTQKNVLNSLIDIRNSAQVIIGIGNNVEKLLNKMLQNGSSTLDGRDTNGTMMHLSPRPNKTAEVDFQCVIKNDTNLPDRVVVKLDDHKETLCDTKTDGGGWIIIQRRLKGDINFTRGWSDYKHGFGTTSGDFWLGNDWISNLTLMGYNWLRVDMTFRGINYSTEYTDFTLGDEASCYLIHFKMLRDSTDSFTRHSDHKFTTIDRDNDYAYSDNCARLYKGGWWYGGCHGVNINGVWGSRTYGMGLNWVGITGYTDSLSFVEMKVRKR